VLSAGSARGLAHLGALRAINEQGIRPSCVVGSSMGALIGALYASAPAADTTVMFDAFAARYLDLTQQASTENGLAAGLVFGGLAAVFTGGVAVPMAAAMGGFLLGADATSKVDHERVVAALGEVTGHARIENLPLAFATLSAQQRGEGIALVDERAGPLAEAVGRSIANPYIFPKLDVQHAPGLDPGMDRMAAIPVADACRLFPGAALLVVNVTDAPAVFDRSIACEVLEIRASPGPLSLAQAFAGGPERQAAIEAGYQATKQALAQRR